MHFILSSTSEIDTSDLKVSLLYFVVLGVAFSLSWIIVILFYLLYIDKKKHDKLENKNKEENGKT